MNDQFPLSGIQEALTEANIDAWLLYDFRGSNAIAKRIVHLSDRITTRRWFYLIPSSGDPIKIVQAIEANNLDHLPGKKIVFRSWQDLHKAIADTLKGRRRIAMEYSPENDIPYVSLVDAGTIELVRKQGVEVISSADLVQHFEARWSQEQTKSHFEAAKNVNEVKDAGFRFIANRIHNGQSVNEYEVQQFMWELFKTYSLEADHPAIVAVNANASNPHYAPEPNVYAPIQEGDLVLIDIWGKQKRPRAIYADITWTAFVGPSVPEKFNRIFQIVKGAQRAAFTLIQSNFQTGPSGGKSILQTPGIQYGILRPDPLPIRMLICPSGSLIEST